MKQKHSSAPASVDPLHKAKETGAKIVEDLTAAATAKTEQFLHAAKEQVQGQATELFENFENSALLQETCQHIRAKPLQSMLMVLGVGVVIGLSMRR